MVRVWLLAKFLGVILMAGALLAPTGAMAQSAAQKCRNLSGDASIAACDIAVKQNPRDANSFYNRGNAFAGKGEDDRAIADYDEAIKINPKFVNAYFNRANSWANKGDDERAIADYGEVIRLNAKYAYAWFNRANSLARKGDAGGDAAIYERALADYRQAVKLIPASDPFRRQAQERSEEMEGKIAALEKEKPAIEAKKEQVLQEAVPPGAVVATGGKRLALVIGNGAYRATNPLRNPRNDAEALSAALQGIGFEVIKGVDLDKAGMEEIIRSFARQAPAAGITLFFYAGHGIQIGSRNYMFPVDARLEDETAVQFELLDVEETVVRHMGGEGKTGIVLLDACRNNPLARSFSKSFAASRSGTVGAGLAPMEGDGGLLIAFAAAPGQVASDGDGANSPFTAALLRHVPTPGVEIEQMMKRVRSDVYASSGKRQEPWQNSSLRAEIFLVPK